MKGKGVVVSDDESSTRRMTMENPHLSDSTHHRATPSRSRSFGTVVPETTPTAVPLPYRRTARMRTGPYCPMPTIPPIYQAEASGSRPPAHYTLHPADPYAMPPTATERYSRLLSDFRPRLTEVGSSRSVPEIPGSRGLTPDELKSLCLMSADLRGVVQQSMEHASSIMELYVDLRHAESMAIRAIRMTRRWMWTCYLLMFLLVIVVVRLF